jgi:thiol-disulfide isomerase/thioredoxin
MKTFAIALVVLVLAPLMAVGQVFTITPTQPSNGQSVTLAYDAAAKDATLKGKSGLKGEAMLVSEADPAQLVEFPLTKSGSKWVGSFTLNDERALLILFRVVAGQEQDNGDGNSPCVLVGGKDGKPLRGANLQLGLFLSGSSDSRFKHAKDFAAARSAFSKEKALYPDYWRVYPAEWNTMMRENRTDENKAAIKTALDEYYNRFKGNEEAIAPVLNWFTMTGQPERGVEISKAAIAANPKGPIAEADRRGALYSERDPAKVADLIEKFLADFPQKEATKNQLAVYQVSALVRAKQIDKALALLEKRPNANLYNSIAWDWVEKGENLDQAVKIAKLGVDAAVNPNPQEKPSSISEQDWKDANQNAAGQVYDTYGFGLFKVGKLPESMAAFEQAYTLTKGEEPEITERYLMACNANGKFDKTLEVGKSAVENGKTTEKLIGYYKEAYIKVKGSAKGFDAALASAKVVGAKQLKEKTLKSRINKPAIPFALKDLSGKTVSLESLKGKVVVVDFWATWCGPCKMSFPTLQKVYDHYSKNPAVKILALDTWERVAGKEREDLVKKFIADNKYTYTVLFDEGFVEKYGVDGIPTKFVIDKKGNLAFKAVGFEGADAMYQELTGQIDILLAEKP